MNIAEASPAAKIDRPESVAGKTNNHDYKISDKFQKDELAPEKRREEINRDEIEKALEESEEVERFYDKGFNFNIHEKLDRVWVEIIDRGADEVIKEVPPEDILDVIAGIKEKAGLIIDEKV
ncbi:flagellar protein FlaG [Natranaerofaba carboxydovora]|uniref:flagellar protein FlaG n=1 Tax=Natranaerofaba carboxydovora TaxID=2742683 RepID=UPI001F1434BB|nr:flagellar protein FlaG [Natranaerofaba carboxydovora]UMZ74990.1 FlaG protein [Natranaerofaba carboxydovora]